MCIRDRDNGKPFQQGWSPQCQSRPAEQNEWGVVKTTAIQHGEFWSHENKALPEHLEPRPQIEIQQGDVLMTCAGPRNRCGVACLVTKTRPRLMMSGKMYRFRPHPEVLDANYLSLFIRLHDTQLKIDAMKTGINDSGLNLTHSRFSGLDVVVAPLNEQRRIVERIEAMFDEIDHGVANLKKARTSLALYRQSLLKTAFEGRLTVDWRARNADKLESPETLLARIRSERDARYQAALDDWQKALADWRDNGQKGKKPSKPRRQAEAFMDKEWLEKLPELPGSTSWIACNQVSGQISDGTHKTPTYTDTGIHFISAKDIRDFKVDFSSTRFVDETQHIEMSKRCNVETGNVLLTKSGAIGRVAAVDTATPFSLFESVANIPVLPPMQSRFVAYAVYHIANSYFISHAEKGVAVRHLHLEDIRKMPLPLYGVEEQAEITRILDERLSAADALEAEIDAGLTSAGALRQSILKQAFSGKLVPQDPNDEPAADLLARIKAEKANKPKAPRKRKVSA